MSKGLVSRWGAATYAEALQRQKGLLGVGRKKRVITRGWEMHPSRAPHMHCLWSHGQVPVVKQAQISQDRSPLLWQLVCTWVLAFYFIFDGDIEVHQQLSIAQSTASEKEWSEQGKGSQEAGKGKKRKVLLMEMLNSTVWKSPEVLQLRNDICLANA